MDFRGSPLAAFPAVFIESMWTPCGVRVDSMRTPCGVQRDFPKYSGLHRESSNAVSWTPWTIFRRLLMDSP